MNHEQIKEVLGNAPEGAEFYTGGYQCEYRKWVHGEDTSVVYEYLDGDWKVAIDQDIARERIDKGWYLPNLAEQLEPEQEWEVFHGDDWIPCIRFGLDIYGNHAYQLSDGEFKGEFNGTPSENNFRKPETPEQKAARKKRNKAIRLRELMTGKDGTTFNDASLYHKWLELADMIEFKDDASD